MKALPPRASEENLNLQEDKASTKYLSRCLRIKSSMLTSSLLASSRTGRLVYERRAPGYMIEACGPGECLHGTEKRLFEID
jgi:hypothetical protein